MLKKISKHSDNFIFYLFLTMKKNIHFLVSDFFIFKKKIKIYKNKENIMIIQLSTHEYGKIFLSYYEYIIIYLIRNFFINYK